MGMVVELEPFEDELERARVAWLYFVGGQTLQEIAQRMNITRLKVNRIIGLVWDSGNVHVSVSLPLVVCVDLAAKVSARYGLTEAIVVPDLDDFVEQKRVVGEAAGSMVNMLIHGHDMGVWDRLGSDTEFCRAYIACSAEA